MKKLIDYFSLTEKLLWCCSAGLIILSFILFDRENYLTLAASLIGITSLVFGAKGNPTGQILMVVFSFLYGIISFNYSYYGEMITYLGMTMPMAVIAFISWIRHPHNGNHSEVSVNHISAAEFIFLIILTGAVTVLFYFILDSFGTANIIPSTFSVSTSFAAVYLTFRRDARYAVAYAANDAVLIILWTIAAISDIRYLSVVVCFTAFLSGDIYGFISWRKIKKRQALDVK